MSDSAIHCSLGERAFTDLTTNATYFSGIDLREDIGRLLAIGGFPHESLPSLLHESVHHWCFMTPVGGTLANLQVRSHVQALEWAVTGDDMIAVKAIDDHFRCEAVTLALRPLAEGVAQLFEYDVMPYPSTPIVSMPMLWLYLFFGRPIEEEMQSSWGMSLLQVLGEARISEPMIRRKTNLLLQPLRCSAGGYLPGYLTVKNLWLSCSKHEPFYDADLFAALLRRYFYGDFGLVDRILDRSIVGPDWIVSLIDYIGNRVNSLLHTDLAAAEKTLVETTLNVPEPTYFDWGVRFASYPPMDTAPTVADRGRRRSEDLISSLRKPISAPQWSDDAARVLNNLEMLPLAYRHLLWLGQLEVGLRVSGDNEVSVLVNDNLLFNADLIVDAGDVPDTGLLDLYVSVYQFFIGATVSVGTRVVAFFMRDSVDDRTRETFLSLYGNRESVEEFLESSVRTYDAMANAFNKEMYERLLRHVEGFIEEIYRPGALLSVPRESHSSLSRIMQDDGVLAIVGGDRDLLKSAAALSLGAALRLHPEEITKEIPSFDASVEDVLAKLTQISTEKDFPMLFGEEGYELTSFI